MPNWDVIRDRVTQALGEFDNGAAAAVGSSATYTASTIYRRLEEKYRELLRTATRLSPSRFTKKATVTYTADAESVDISTLSTSLKNKQIVRLEDYTNTDYPLPICIVSEEQRRAWLENGALEDLPSPHDNAPYAAFFEGDLLYLMPKPTSSLSLRAFYLPAITAITDNDAATTSPDLLPEEFHHLIAIEAAISFQAPFGTPSLGLLQERDRIYREFKAELASPRRAGPRYVHGSQ